MSDHKIMKACIKNEQSLKGTRDNSMSEGRCTDKIFRATFKMDHVKLRNNLRNDLRNFYFN